MAAAIEIVTAAGDLAARRFAEGAPATTKADGSPVTAADVEVERLIRDMIAAGFPATGCAGRNCRRHPARPAAGG